ncbi:MAG: SEC59/DGK1/VTE5 family protein [bacterium]|nr:SEC59/DGK1/VTE5 family protein [bacterium]
MEDKISGISLKNELIRKSIHLSSSVIPFSYFFLDRKTEIIILSVFTFLMITVDLLRLKNKTIKGLYLKILGPILRRHETENGRELFTGGTYIVVAYLICVIIFPQPLAIMAMLVIIFCDSAAAITGKVYGKHFIGNKTIEGSLAFFITGVIIVFVTPKLTGSSNEYFVGIAAVLLTTIFELLPLKIDDNISIPVFFGLVYLGLVSMV